MLKLFVVRDAALGQYLNPFVAPSVGFATRSFSDEVNNSSSPLNSHSSDYELFEIGEFNPNTGVISPLLVPLSVVRAKDLIIPSSSGKIVSFGNG